MEYESCFDLVCTKLQKIFKLGTYIYIFNIILKSVNLRELLYTIIIKYI